MAFNWELYPTSDAVWSATLDGISRLQVSSGGYMRNDDALSSYDSDEWVMIDLVASMAMRRAGRSQPADDLLNWVSAQAGANQNLIPELYNQTSMTIPIDAYSGAIPMVGFGAAAYINALADRSGFSSLETGCEATPSAVDMGSSMVPPSDGGEGVPDLARPPVTVKNGCSCEVGGRAPAPTGSLLLLLLMLSRRRARAFLCRDRAAD
jgi:hypothetical protein